MQVKFAIISIFSKKSNFFMKYSFPLIVSIEIMKIYSINNCDRI